ncbi:DNA polymerase III subunit alpha [bacterium]|nr:DNA polymerase III subunit alpha [bacterium]
MSVTAADIAPLHVRSPFSFYEGASPVPELVEIAKTLGHRSLAITDRNRTSALVKLTQEAQKQEIQPVLGLLLDDPKDPRRMVTLWARNLVGYHELGRLAADRQLRPDFSLDQAAARIGDGVIAAAGEVELLDALHRCLPPGSVYGELTLPDSDRAKARTRRLYDHCRRRRVPMVVTGSVAMSTPDKRRTYDLLQAIGSREVLYRNRVGDQAAPARPMDDDGELLRAFRSLPEALVNSRLIAEQCEVDLQLGQLKFPDPQLPDGQVPFEELRRRTEEGLRKRYGTKPGLEAKRRLAYELGVIDHLGYTGYMLVVHDIAREAWSRGVRTLGRGSAANSIVCYTLFLTDICPLKYNLYFERFLNPERTSPPDVDLDFSWRDRDEVLHRVYDTYGHDRVAMICTHVTFKARGALREAALARGIPNDEIRRVTSRVPYFTSTEGLENLPEESPECRDLPLDREPWASIARDANGLLRLPRHTSIHAGGIVITPDPITHWTGLENAAKGFVVTQYDMYGIEDLGLLKIDLLSQRSLGVLKDATNAVERHTGERPPIDHVERLFRDRETWQQIRAGNTMGVFYAESPGMQALLKKLDCVTFELLVAASSVIRPGVSESGMMQQFIECTRDPSKAVYLHPKMKELLGETHGVMIYQEDVMKVAHHIAGMPLGKADSLRRAMSGKYRSSEEMAKVRDRFLDGCVESGVDRETTREIWRQVSSFAGYAFCKAHSASFAVLSVQIAYLRTHHPAEFIAGVLANGGGYYSQAAYIEEARRMGLRLLPPHVNESALEHEGHADWLRIGLKAIGTLHDDTPQRILDERERNGPFRDLGDVVRRVQPTRDEVEALIAAGALDGFAANRPTLLRNARAGFRVMRHGPGPLAGDADDIFATLPDARDWSDEEHYLAERRILGYSVGPHPLTLLDLPMHGCTPARALERNEGRQVTMIGWAITFKRILTRREKEVMKFASMEDLTGTFEVTFFPRVYQRFAPLLHGPGPYRVRGKVENDQGVCSLVASHVERLRPLDSPETAAEKRGGWSLGGIQRYEEMTSNLG